jgi:hypothetical protein
MMHNQKKKKATLGRHENGCRICSHPQKLAIEHDFIAWKSPAKIAKEFKLRDRSTVYRHAHALNLFPKRARNLKGALERIIEKCDDVPVNASAVVAAITAYGKLNSQGQLVERTEQISLNELFERMNAEELECYARDGELPDWFLEATGQRGRGGEDDE